MLLKKLHTKAASVLEGRMPVRCVYTFPPSFFVFRVHFVCGFHFLVTFVVVVVVVVVPSCVQRPICSGWLAAAKTAGVETVETAPALGLLLSVKDSNEVDNIKRAAILTNKVCLRSSTRTSGCVQVYVLPFFAGKKPPSFSSCTFFVCGLVVDEL